MEKIKLDAISFEYNQRPYGDVEIHILQFKEHWEIKVVNERKTGCLWYRYLDTYNIVNNEIIYQDTETDVL